MKFWVTEKKTCRWETNRLVIYFFNTKLTAIRFFVCFFNDFLRKETYCRIFGYVRAVTFSSPWNPTEVSARCRFKKLKLADTSHKYYDEYRGQTNEKMARTGGTARGEYLADKCEIATRERIVLPCTTVQWLIGNPIRLQYLSATSVAINAI